MMELIMKNCTNGVPIIDAENEDEKEKLNIKYFK